MNVRDRVIACLRNGPKTDRQIEDELGYTGTTGLGGFRSAFHLMFRDGTLEMVSPNDSNDRNVRIKS